jgi:signal transduction histidine kinase
MHDRKDNLWVASFGQGLWRVPRGDSGAPDPRVAERATLRTGLASDSVQSMFEDRNGNIWVGTTGGLHRLRQRPLTPLEHVGFVATVEPTATARMWAGTPDGLVQLTADAGTQQRMRLGAARPDIRVFHSGSDGALWVGATDGLWRYARGELARIPIPIRPLSISAGRQGDLWLRDDSWLYRYDGRSVARFDAVQPTAPGFAKITFARADRTGRLWVGFAGGQLGYLGADGQFETLGQRHGWSTEAHGVIHAVFEGSDGAVWFGGSGGLSRFEGGRMITVSQRNGLPGNQVWAITEDDQHHLWLSVDRGLIHLDSKEVTTALADPSYRMRYRLFDAADGVAGAAVGAIGIVKANDGTLWFVRGGGVTLMSPAESLAIEEDTLETARVRIESATADMHRFRPAAHTLLPSGTTRLQINYTALTLAASNQIRFRYRLDGFDEDWVDAGTRRTAFYTNMSPRAYAFVVEASSQDGIWTSSTASWDFTIQPAFHQTRAFFALCAAVLALMVGAAWRIRLSWIHQRFALVLEERARLSREIHDTLLQSLVGVALQLDAVSDLVAAAPSSACAQLVRIRRQVESYIREARQSIWDLRSPRLDAQDLIKVLRGIGRDAVTNSSIRFVASIKGAPRRYPPALENQLRRIGQEAITNAVRHAGATRIALELHFDESAVGLRVEDDGRGFEYPGIETNNHYGLTTMRERAEALHGEFRISTGAGRGTVIEAVVPTAARSRS